MLQVQAWGGRGSRARPARRATSNRAIPSADSETRQTTRPLNHVVETPARAPEAMPQIGGLGHAECPVRGMAPGATPRNGAYPFAELPVSGHGFGPDRQVFGWMDGAQDRAKSACGGKLRPLRASFRGGLRRENPPKPAAELPFLPLGGRLEGPDCRGAAGVVVAPSPYGQESIFGLEDEQVDPLGRYLASTSAATSSQRPRPTRTGSRVVGVLGRHAMPNGVPEDRHWTRATRPRATTTPITDRSSTT